MTVTTQRLEHTPRTGSGYSILEASKKRDVSTWVEAKEVRKNNFTEWVPRRKTPFEQFDIETGQSYAPFIRTTLGAQAGAGDEQLTFASTALMNVGDQGIIEQFYSGSTTEYDDTLTERFTILTIDSATLATVHRHEGAVSDGSYTVHASGSRVTIVSHAENYNEPFGDAVTFRGDMMVQHPQRFTSGEITYDTAAVGVGDFEAPNGHYMTDIMYWKKQLPYERNDAFINGILHDGDELSTPKIPMRMRGAVSWASQLAANIVAIDGQLSFFDFSDIFEDMATTHADGPGDAIWMAPRMLTIWSEMLLPYKGMLSGKENTLDVSFNYRGAFGDVTQKGVKTDNQWRPSKILITSKSDWFRSHFVGMPWTYVERGEKELGAFQQSWTMGGDFSIVCENVSHQRILTGIDTRKDNYAARTAFL